MSCLSRWGRTDDATVDIAGAASGDGATEKQRGLGAHSVGVHDDPLEARQPSGHLECCVRRTNLEDDVGCPQQFGNLVERSESCLLGSLQARFAAAGAQPPDLVAETNKAADNGRTHRTGM